MNGCVDESRNNDVRSTSLAAARGSFQVCTLPALPFEEFVKVVDEIRPSESPTIGVNE